MTDDPVDCLRSLFILKISEQNFRKIFFLWKKRTDMCLTY
jgi:hypothetical protein